MAKKPSDIIRGFETIEVFPNKGGQITLRQASPPWRVHDHDDHHERISIPREFIPILIEKLKRAAT